MSAQIPTPQQYFIGVMSGTSLDGIDCVLCQFGPANGLVANSHMAYPPAIKQEILALHDSGDNELQRAAILANQLSALYAQAIQALLAKAALDTQAVCAIGCHGQTIRHRPELGYTLQLQNPALLAELTGITVVADFRSRDIAAGGQGAPLVPAFHQALFAHPQRHRVVVNIGGIANLTLLIPNQPTLGFDSGPGNILMDLWIQQHLQKDFDVDGAWAMTGQVHAELLANLLDEPFLQLAAPKSTGRDLFNHHWLQQKLSGLKIATQDVQATLLEFTCLTIAQAIQAYAPSCQEVYLCGGGANNLAMLQNLRQKLHPVKIAVSDELGVPVNLVEAYAFAWLARQTMLGKPSNLPSVTGASGERVLGAIYAR